MEELRGASPLHVRLRRLDPVRTVSLACVAVVVGVVALRALPALRGLGRDANALAAMPSEQRAFLGARSVDIDPRVFLAARELIPPGATYFVATGPHVGVSNASTLASVGPFARYYLLPRRQTLDPAQAQWIVSYGGDLDALGLRFLRRVPVQEGVELAEVAR